MAKFGWFDGNSQKHLREFEGDWLEFKEDSVLVMTRATDNTSTNHAYAVIRLLPGQTVTKLKD